MAKRKLDVLENELNNEPKLSTIHIFGYGETQTIGNQMNKKVSSSLLTKLDAVVNDVFSKKPVDNNSDLNYHSINIFNNMYADYQPKEKEQKSFRVKFNELDNNLITELVTEIMSIEVVDNAE